jgi:hypothetical protein
MESVGEGVLGDSFNGDDLLDALGQGLSKGNGGEEENCERGCDELLEAHVVTSLENLGQLYAERVSRRAVEWQHERGFPEGLKRVRRRH